MTSSPRQNRCDTLLALIDECLADYERSSTTARTNRRHHTNPEVLS